MSAPGTFRTCRDFRVKSAFGGEAEVGSAKGSFWRKAAIRRDQHVAEGPTPDMQRRIVDRVEPKTLFPFGAPGECPRACGTIRWASPVIDTGSSGFRRIAWAGVHAQSRGVDRWGGPIAYRPIFMCAT
jgi:hypothetical protein